MFCEVNFFKIIKDIWKCEYKKIKVNNMDKSVFLGVYI